MVYISYNKLLESEFDGTVSKRDILQDLNINQIKLEVLDTYKKDEKLTTDFEAVDDKAVINKAYLDEKLKKINGHIFTLKKNTTNLITIQQTKDKRYLNSKSCKNDDTNTL